ncbi:hypothetical protein [uncultured Marinobacter sp.]|uniref:hypothetical protein n=1 Tax=uncultured Marinobacter sp. TaxID=187379 RepID=UPI0030D9E4BA
MKADRKSNITPDGTPAPAPASYAELHCFSNFTFLTGASHPHELIERAWSLGYQALAITDSCSQGLGGHESTEQNPGH